MYFDEDGDLAHEFYTEQRVKVKSGVVRWVMRKVSSSQLTPQVNAIAGNHSPISLLTASPPSLPPSLSSSREKFHSRFHDYT